MSRSFPSEYVAGALRSAPLDVTLEVVTPLSISRRRMPVRSHTGIPPLQIDVDAPGFQRRATHYVPRSAASREFRATRLPLSDTINLHKSAPSTPSSSHLKRVRPLPPVPMSAPALSPANQIPVYSPRPLPSLPPSRPLPTVEISITPPTPSSSHARTVSCAKPLPEFPPVRPPPGSLSVQTSPEALARRRCSNGSSFLSPVSPLAPSPLTARKRRLSKLRRHFGERVPDDLVRRPSSAALTKKIVLEKLEQIGEVRLYAQAGATVKKMLEVHPDEDDSDEDSDAWEDEKGEDDYTWVLANGAAFRAVPIKRYSPKWVRECKGERWEEKDYQNILRDLRAL